MPHYNLDSIREAAKQQNIRYRGGRRGVVHRNISNYGYTLTDVVNLITSLSSSNFLTTTKYPDQTVDDSYIIKVARGEDEVEDKIFMKLRLLDDGEIQIVDIGTIHLTKR